MRQGASRKVVLLAAALATAGLTRAARAEGLAVSISPPLVEMAVASGGDRSFSVTVTNEGRSEFRARAEVVDLELDAEGNPLPKVPSGGSQIGRWVSVLPGEVAIAPGRRQEVRCRVRAPRGAAGGRYGAILFTADRPTEFRASGMRLTTRLGTVLMLTVPHTERRQAEMTEAEARAATDGAVRIRAELRNTGNVHLRVAGEVLLREAGGRVAGRAKLAGGTGTVLPGGVRRFTGLWRPRRLAPGTYRAEVRLQAPGMRAVTRAVEFAVPAPPPIAASPGRAVGAQPK